MRRHSLAVLGSLSLGSPAHFYYKNMRPNITGGAWTFIFGGGGSLEPPGWTPPPPQKAPMTGPPKST